MKDSSSKETGEYVTIRGMAVAELRVKKSRFIALAASIDTEQDAADFINKARAEFPNATHYCYAYTIGAGAKKIFRSNDAGEPANSAGKPILQAVESSGFRNAICRSEEHTSELQSHSFISYAVFCL